MAAGVNQFGADITHGTIIGWKSLIKLGHVTANGRFLFNEIDPETLIGQIKRCLYTGNSAAYNQDAPAWVGQFAIILARLIHVRIIHLLLQHKPVGTLSISDGRHTMG
jgi:hypothetical protein